MKYYLKTLRLLLCACIFLLILGTGNVSKAQCSQCVAAVETNRQAGNEGLAKGLNNGIVYLLCMPYAALAIVGFIWYKKFRKKGIPLNLPSEKLHLN